MNVSNVVQGYQGPIFGCWADDEVDDEFEFDGELALREGYSGPTVAAGAEDFQNRSAKLTQIYL